MKQAQQEESANAREKKLYEAIAENMQALIRFGRQQTQKLRDVQTVAQHKPDWGRK